MSETAAELNYEFEAEKREANREIARGIEKRHAMPASGYGKVTVFFENFDVVRLEKVESIK